VYAIQIGMLEQQCFGAVQHSEGRHGKATLLEREATLPEQSNMLTQLVLVE